MESKLFGCRGRTWMIGWAGHGATRRHLLVLAGHQISTITTIRPYPFFAQGLPEQIGETFIKIFDPAGSLRSQDLDMEQGGAGSVSFGEGQGTAAARGRPPGSRQYPPRGVSGATAPVSSRPAAGEERTAVRPCPHTAKVGDIVVVLYGGKVPYVLRETATAASAADAVLGGGGKRACHFAGECFPARICGWEGDA